MDMTLLTLTDPAYLVAFAAGSASYPLGKKILQVLLILIVVKKIFDSLIFISKSVIWFTKAFVRSLKYVLRRTGRSNEGTTANRLTARVNNDLH